MAKPLHLLLVLIGWSAFVFGQLNDGSPKIRLVILGLARALPRWLCFLSIASARV
jgi:hypothetical protein